MPKPKVKAKKIKPNDKKIATSQLSETQEPEASSEKDSTEPESSPEIAEITWEII